MAKNNIAKSPQPICLEKVISYELRYRADSNLTFTMIQFAGKIENFTLPFRTYKTQRIQALVSGIPNLFLPRTLKPFKKFLGLFFRKGE
jgi:hypothetical protein